MWWYPGMSYYVFSPFPTVLQLQMVSSLRICSVFVGLGFANWDW